MESVVGEKIILGIDPGTNVMGYGIITVLNEIGRASCRERV